jgi:hypothetical protein
MGEVTEEFEREARVVLNVITSAAAKTRSRKPCASIGRTAEARIGSVSLGTR